MTRIALGLSLSAALVIEPYQIIGPGTLSYANPGVLESVAERRLENGWGLERDWRGYTLVAPADCGLLGREGWLVTSSRIVRVLVVDCENGEDSGQMAERGLLADTNIKSLVHKEGWLVLR